MTWLAWRQFRGQFVTAVVLLVVLGAFLVYAGLAARTAYDTGILGCTAAGGCNAFQARARFLHEFGMTVTVPGILLTALPAIIGLFWGAPLVSREFESNTHRLAWNQGVTRTRWLAVKLALVGLAGVAVTGVVSVLLTWAAAPYDEVQGSRFDALNFSARNIVPLGHAAFAFVVGVVAGLLLRRTVPAMAATLLAVAVLQILIPGVARGHLLAPVTASVPYDVQAKERGGRLEIRAGATDPVLVSDYAVPGALMFSSEVKLLNAAGETVYSPAVGGCLRLAGGGEREAEEKGELDPLESCVAGLGLHFDVSYQPAGRYWTFQWIEFTGFTVLAFLLSGVAFWRIRRVTA